MSYDLSDFLTHDTPMKDIIKTANGEGIKVSRAGTISFTKNLTLKNCLFVPDLSHKLLSVSQLTRDLDCTVLMKPECCVVQHVQTGKIIGHGIERGGLYYLEEETQKRQSSSCSRVRGKTTVDLASTSRTSISRVSRKTFS